MQKFSISDKRQLYERGTLMRFAFIINAYGEINKYTRRSVKPVRIEKRYEEVNKDMKFFRKCLALQKGNMIVRLLRSFAVVIKNIEKLARTHLDLWGINKEMQDLVANTETNKIHEHRHNVS